MITINRLKYWWHYDPETGIFTRKVSRNSGKAGSCPTAVNSRGYVTIGADGKVYQAHRLAWFYMTGDWPTNQIDHRDGDKTNNKWMNLRNATPSQNTMNMKKRPGSKSVLKGASWSKCHKKWHARIRVNHKELHLGFFDCLAAAHLSYVVAADKYFGEFARAA